MNTHQQKIGFIDSIETDRLIIRRPRLSDIDIVHAAKIASLDHLAPWFFWAQDRETMSDRASTVEFIHRGMAKHSLKEDFLMLVFNKQTDEFIASSGIHPKHWDAGLFEIGYWANVKALGNGYITEATNAQTRHAFDNMNAKTMTIRAREDNLKSRAVPERLGFDFNGIMIGENPHAITNEPANNARYSLQDISKLPPLAVKYTFL